MKSDGPPNPRVQRTRRRLGRSKRAEFEELQLAAWRTSAFVAIATALIIIVGCAHGSYTSLVANPPAPRTPGCSLDIFDNPSDVARPFKRVCLISGESGAMATMDEAMGEIRKNACKCGAQAIELGQVQNQGNRMSGIKINMTAYGIVYQDAAEPRSTP